jgi:hypothetical protein
MSKLALLPGKALVIGTQPLPLSIDSVTVAPPIELTKSNESVAEVAPARLTARVIVLLPSSAPSRLS